MVSASRYKLYLSAYVHKWENRRVEPVSVIEIFLSEYIAGQLFSDQWNIDLGVSLQMIMMVIICLFLCVSMSVEKCVGEHGRQRSGETNSHRQNTNILPTNSDYKIRANWILKFF